MPRQVPDSRFGTRPFYRPADLDRLCETILAVFFRSNGGIPIPIPTDDLTRLIERDTCDFDPGADLSSYGLDVEGVTEFSPGQKPRVRISAALAGDERRENRYRTTLTHEYGHVHLHTPLFELAQHRTPLIAPSRVTHVQVCKRDTMLGAGKVDWMEWQAGYACGALLMPITALRRVTAAYQEAHSLFGPIGRATNHGAALVEAVREQFRVSEDAARVRLSVTGILGEAPQGASLFG